MPAINKGNPTSAPPDDIAARIMVQMVRMPPKPHEEMKLGQPRGKRNEATGRAPKQKGKRDDKADR